MTGEYVGILEGTLDGESVVVGDILGYCVLDGNEDGLSDGNDVGW